jgi:hypothetical protein
MGLLNKFFFLLSLSAFCHLLSPPTNCSKFSAENNENFHLELVSSFSSYLFRKENNNGKENGWKTAKLILSIQQVHVSRSSSLACSLLLPYLAAYGISIVI